MHGYLASGQSFFNQISHFSRDFEVFAPDLTGFGDNKNMPYPYSLDDYIDSVSWYMEENEIINPFIVAHSFGGRIAIKGLATKRLNAKKLVLTGSAGLKPKWTIKKQVKKTCFSVLKKFVKKEKLIRFYSKDYQSLNQTMKSSFVKIITEHLDDYLPLLQTKTLIINGKLDKETPLYMAKKLNKNIENSTLKMFDGCGHFCFLDKPNKFNMEVREFFLS